MNSERLGIYGRRIEGSPRPEESIETFIGKCCSLAEGRRNRYMLLHLGPYKASRLISLTMITGIVAVCK